MHSPITQIKGEVESIPTFGRGASSDVHHLSGKDLHSCLTLNTIEQS